MDGILYRGIELTAPIIIGTVPLVSFQPSAPPQGGNNIGWTVDNSQSLYPNLRKSKVYLNSIITIFVTAPPTYEESTFGKADTIQDKDDNEHTIGIGGWVPRYPSFNFTPSAPLQN